MSNRKKKSEVALLVMSTPELGSDRRVILEFQVEFKLKVALKKMKEGDDKATQEFLDEINTFKEVVHPNIVQVFSS